MFCFQCKQTAGCKSCAGKVGVCGKNADTAEIQDKLTGALIGLARATEGNEHKLVLRKEKRRFPRESALTFPENVKRRGLRGAIPTTTN